ncbi:hypothetical protein MKZ38_000405 [Zalerion maritima]|uniref:Rhodopsin domain-containing protein n=1 Tax=Zalerion maritima TaxID=339359 RepID=A0AAD5RXZ4_9PEZI|nr:hypothetical protein MKZ38_000405 [Zalerion maritima]
MPPPPPPLPARTPPSLLLHYWGLAGPVAKPLFTSFPTSSSFSLQSNLFLNPDAKNRGHAIVASVGVFAGAAGLFLFLRVFSRLRSRGIRGIGVDDSLLIIAWILTVAQCTSTTFSVLHGYGQFSPAPSYPSPSYSVVASLHPLVLAAITHDRLLSFIFTSLASACAKVSFSLSLLRLATHRPWMWWQLWFTIASSCLLQFVVVLIPFIACKPAQKLWEPWLEGECTSYVYGAEQRFGVFASVYSGLQDLLLTFLFPWYLLPQLYIYGPEWVGVIAAMVMGTMGSVSSFLLTSYILHPYPSSALFSEPFDFTRPGISLTPLILSEPAFLVIASSIPFLRNLLGVHKPGGVAYLERYGPTPARSPTSLRKAPRCAGRRSSKKKSSLSGGSCSLVQVQEVPPASQDGQDDQDGHGHGHGDEHNHHFLPRGSSWHDSTTDPDGGGSALACGACRDGSSSGHPTPPSPAAAAAAASVSVSVSVSPRISPATHLPYSRSRPRVPSVPSAPSVPAAAHAHSSRIHNHNLGRDRKGLPAQAQADDDDDDDAGPHPGRPVLIPNTSAPRPADAMGTERLGRAEGGSGNSGAGCSAGTSSTTDSRRRESHWSGSRGRGQDWGWDGGREDKTGGNKAGPESPAVKVSRVDTSGSFEVWSSASEGERERQREHWRRYSGGGYYHDGEFPAGNNYGGGCGYGYGGDDVGMEDLGPVPSRDVSARERV